MPLHAKWSMKASEVRCISEYEYSSDIKKGYQDCFSKCDISGHIQVTLPWIHRWYDLCLYAAKQSLFSLSGKHSKMEITSNWIRRILESC